PESSPLFSRETRSVWRLALLLPHSYWRSWDGRRSSTVLARPACYSPWRGSRCIPTNGLETPLLSLEGTRAKRAGRFPWEPPRPFPFGLALLLRLRAFAFALRAGWRF